MKFIKRALAFVIFILVWTISLSAQTCCSGGVPVSSHLGLDSDGKKSLVTSFSWDYNLLSTLKEGTEVVGEGNRERTTHSFILQMNYGITDRFSVDILTSFVRQSRLINTSGYSDEDVTFGLGDLALLFKYQFLNTDKLKINLGAGPKLPTGSYDKKDDRGIFYSADLQSGSGTVDILYRVGVIYSPFVLRSAMSISATTIYSQRGTNEDYLTESDSYKFGDEFQLVFVVSDRVTVLGEVVDFSLGTIYRHAAQDVFNHDGIPSTGGEWLFVRPGFTWWSRPDLAVSFHIILPAYASVVGTQLSPTLRTSITIQKKISFNNSKLISHETF